MPFIINKCQILQVGSRNIKKDYEMCGVKIESVSLVKELGVTVASNLKDDGFDLEKLFIQE